MNPIQVLGSELIEDAAQIGFLDVVGQIAHVQRAVGVVSGWGSTFEAASASAATSKASASAATAAEATAALSRCSHARAARTRRTRGERPDADAPTIHE